MYPPRFAPSLILYIIFMIYFRSLNVHTVCVTFLQEKRERENLKY